MSDVLADKPLPVTDGDVEATWQEFFRTPHHNPPPFRDSDHHDRHTFEQLRKVLVHDRQRVFERSSQ